MARLAFFLLPLGLLASIGACGDDGAQGGSGPGTDPSGPVTTGKNTGGGTTNNNGGDCTTNSECPGGQCVPLTPGGFRTCKVEPTPTTQCGINMGGGGVGGEGGEMEPLDECCNIEDFDCGGDNICIRTPSYPTCAPTGEPPHNVCSDDADECESAADCEQQFEGGAGICIPAGTLGSQVRKCIRIACAVDTDCTAQPGGRCVPVEEQCCTAIRGLYCTYDGNACRGESDCAGGYCKIENGVASCATGTAPNCPN